jgi:regulator of protease activity HflC (stomatin/prohibitin superfamily)
MVREMPIRPTAGWVPLIVSLALIVAGPLWIFQGFAGPRGGPTAPVVIAAIGLVVLGVIGLFGLLAISPNQARVLLLFGTYRGSVKESGFFWVNPFYSKKHISLRIRNFETGSSVMTRKETTSAGATVTSTANTAGKPSKVNDRDGNPVEISAIVVWRVVDTAEALLEVEDYEGYVGTQSEAALRGMASRFPYDSEDHEVSLRGNTVEISDRLREDIQDRLGRAGVEVIEARISYLAYAPEIAAAMLQRQQAQAVVAARTKIVEGAVGMVQMALDQLEKDGVVDLDDERKAVMVSNLLVVLCSDRHTQPVVNAGTLY